MKSFKEIVEGMKQEGLGVLKILTANEQKKIFELPKHYNQSLGDNNSYLKRQIKTRTALSHSNLLSKILEANQVPAFTKEYILYHTAILSHHEPVRSIQGFKELLGKVSTLIGKEVPCQNSNNKAYLQKTAFAVDSILALLSEDNTGKDYKTKIADLYQEYSNVIPDAVFNVGRHAFHKLKEQYQASEAQVLKVISDYNQPAQDKKFVPIIEKKHLVNTLLSQIDYYCNIPKDQLGAEDRKYIDKMGVYIQQEIPKEITEREFRLAKWLEVSRSMEGQQSFQQPGQSRASEPSSNLQQSSHQPGTSGASKPWPNIQQSPQQPGPSRVPRTTPQSPNIIMQAKSQAINKITNIIMSFERQYGGSSTQQLLLKVREVTDSLYSSRIAQSVQERNNTNIHRATESNQLPYLNPSIILPRVPTKTPGLISEMHDNVQSPTASQHTDNSSPSLSEMHPSPLPSTTPDIIQKVGENSANIRRMQNRKADQLQSSSKGDTTRRSRRLSSKRGGLSSETPGLIGEMHDNIQSPTASQYTNSSSPSLSEMHPSPLPSTTPDIIQKVGENSANIRRMQNRKADQLQSSGKGNTRRRSERLSSTRDNSSNKRSKPDTAAGIGESSRDAGEVFYDKSSTSAHNIINTRSDGKAIQNIIGDLAESINSPSPKGKASGSAAETEEQVQPPRTRSRS